MDLEGLYGASFIDWEAVSASWSKRTVTSRLLLFAARRYLKAEPGEKQADRAELVGPASLPEEIKAAFATPPDPESTASRPWGEFVDAAVAAELEMVPYGERPVLLGELRAGLTQAAEEAGSRPPLSRWFLERRDALPGEDLPENPEYLPVQLVIRRQTESQPCPQRHRFHAKLTGIEHQLVNLSGQDRDLRLDLRRGLLAQSVWALASTVGGAAGSAAFAVLFFGVPILFGLVLGAAQALVLWRYFKEAAAPRTAASFAGWIAGWLVFLFVRVLAELVGGLKIDQQAGWPSFGADMFGPLVVWVVFTASQGAALALVTLVFGRRSVLPLAARWQLG